MRNVIGLLITLILYIEMCSSPPVFRNTREEGYHTRVMLSNEAEDECYKRYKRSCYRYLVLKSLLSFLLGIFLARLFYALL